MIDTSDPRLWIVATLALTILALFTAYGLYEWTEGRR